VINVKLSVVLGGIGFVLSLAVGLLSGAGFPHVLIRAGVFGLVFFALGCVLWLMINNFVPELLSADAPAAEESADLGETPGSKVNITLEDPKILPEMYQNLDHGDEVGNIGDLVSGAFKPEETAVLTPLPLDGDGQGMDQKPQAGYTETENRGAVPLSDDAEVLPDLDSMAGSFMDGVDEGFAGPAELPEPVRKASGNKSQKLEGDFDPKELAAGIRTVLKKDE
jgi:hypothetical protein